MDFGFILSKDLIDEPLKISQVILGTLKPDHVTGSLPCINRLLKRPLALEFPFGHIFESCL